jgi:crotonobetainyl-CoA:carnitine CoA-transferase CaiB-like acyl-CoA transferase
MTASHSASVDALAGLTVLDLTSHIAGPYATKVLADLGARVIKVERPGGDCSRKLGPFLEDIAGVERSGTYQFLNTNKESIVVDLKSDAGGDVLRRLASRVDLVVHAFPPLVAERLGTDYDHLSQWTDAPVLSITNFGTSGPYRDYQLSDTVLFAMGGEMWSHGLADREPLKIGETAALLQCGAMAGIAALGAVHAKEVHGIGQHVEVSLFDVQINNVDRRSSCILSYRFSGRLQSRPENAGGGIAGGVYPVADGHVEVTASSGSYWNRFVEMIDDDALRHPRWSNPAIALDPSAKEEADAIVYPWMLSRTRQEVWREARRARAMVAPLYSGIDVAADPVFRERGLWTEVEHSVLGRFPMLSRPYVLEKTPWRIRTPAPMLGEHTDLVLAYAGYDSTQIAALREEGRVA